MSADNVRTRIEYLKTGMGWSWKSILIHASVHEMLVSFQDEKLSYKCMYMIKNHCGPVSTHTKLCAKLGKWE